MRVATAAPQQRPGWRWLATAILACATPALAQTLTSSAGLSFGAFAAMPGAGGGTVALAPNGSRTTPAGRLMLIGHAGVSPAQFTLSGTPGTAYHLSLPLNGTVFLTHAQGHTMAVNGFSIAPGATGTLSGTDRLLSVGATLSVDGAQAPGAYSGSFHLTVNHP